MDEATGVLPVDVCQFINLCNYSGAFKQLMRYGKIFITATGGKPQTIGKNTFVD